MNDHYTFDNDGNRVTSDKSVNFLGIHIDHKLSFDKHVFSLCK